jgi:hypothetical protein
MNKYHARKCAVGDEVFDSRKEMRRWNELIILEKAGKISALKRQVKYILVPAQREVVIKKGVPKQGKVIEREISYTADFVYYDNQTKEVVVEDSKGYRTKDYIIKRKLMLYIHGIRIKEV